MSERKISNLLKGDKVLWTVFFLLSVFSMIEVYSAASTLTYRTGDYSAPLFKHVGFLIAGAVVMWFAHKVPTKYLRLIPACVLPFSWLFLALAPFIADTVNGASRLLWATELAKISTVVSVAVILSKLQEEHMANKKAMKYTLIIMGITFILILPSNLSSAALVFLAVFGMMVFGRVSWVQLTKFIGVLSVVGALGVGSCLMIPEKSLKELDHNVLTRRVTTWIWRVRDFVGGGEDEEEVDIYGKKSQRIYADLAMQEGGVFGKGPGNSKYRDFLPQAYSDFIYSIILEETGIFGGLVVFFLYIVILVRSSQIAFRSKSSFSTFLVLGLALLLVLQAFVNMAVAVGAMPITGQPLPFVSRGGWPIISSSVILGIIIGVSRINNKEMKHELVAEEIEGSDINKAIIA